jgi:type 1 glutamine amidotransferase
VKLQVTELRLPTDQTPDPPPNQPRPGALLDAELPNRFDVILAYHQGEKLGLNREELDNLLSFVRLGGGWVGLHCAADSWKWCRDYVAMVGGRFQTHPPFQPLTAQRVLGDHRVLDGVADSSTTARSATRACC